MECVSNVYIRNVGRYQSALHYVPEESCVCSRRCGNLTPVTLANSKSACKYKLALRTA
jgi:hypothetical protein